MKNGLAKMARPRNALSVGYMGPAGFTDAARRNVLPSAAGLRRSAEAAASSQIPGLADMASGALAVDDARQGNWGSAGLNALGLLPFVPALGSMTKFAPAMRSGVIDVAKTADELPPVREGFVRLYRAESPTTKFKDVFEDDGLWTHASDKPGKYYTNDVKYADYFRQSYGKDAQMHFIDVPAKDAERFRLNDYEFKVEAGQ